MLQKAVMATAIVYALAGMAQADSTTVMGSNHHNTIITQQTSHHKPGHGPGAPGGDNDPPGSQAQGSLVKANIHNEIKKTGDITAMIKDGDNNQANAASIAVNGAMVDGQAINDVGKTSDIISMIQDGDNNQANAASVSLN